LNTVAELAQVNVFPAAITFTPVLISAGTSVCPYLLDPKHTNFVLVLAH